LFPVINLPEVVVATFYSGMPPEDERAIVGGLTSSVFLTVFIVPAAYLLVYRRRSHHVRESS
jgi:hypothetical protein